MLTFSAFAGCTNSDIRKYPDYSDSTSNIKLYALYGPSDGRKSGGRLMGDGTDFRTKERYQEYKDAGFNILIIENEAAYRGQEWSTCDTKMVMDLCFEVGLDVIVHDVRLYNMVRVNNAPAPNLIGQTYNGIKIKEQADLNAIVGEYMKDYMKHPAFYGVYVLDEPVSEEMPNCLMVVNAIKAVDPNAFIHLCLQTSTMEEHIGEYAKQGWTDLVFDTYHAMYDRKNPLVGGNKYNEKTDTKTVGSNFIGGLEMSANYARENGLTFSAVTLQSFGGTEDCHNGATNYGWRTIDEVDLQYGVYVSLAYAPDYLCWFHYWASRYSPSVADPVSSWIDEFGNKVWYDEGKKLNEEILKYGKVLSNFTFQGAHYYSDLRRLPKYYQVDNEYTVKGAKVLDIKGEMILSELYDAQKKVKGYFITNSKAPFERKGLTAEVSFPGRKYAVVYKKGNPEIVVLENGVLNVDLECADGILVLPY